MKVTDAMKIAQGKAAQASGQAGVESPTRGADGDKSGVADRISVAHGSVVDEAARIARTNRASRLKEVEAAVHQGAYRPDPAQIAERILDDAETAARLRAALSVG